MDADRIVEEAEPTAFFRAPKQERAREFLRRINTDIMA
jgi:ABC-type polar amino acid transport system ATPase subunit